PLTRHIRVGVGHDGPVTTPDDVATTIDPLNLWWAIAGGWGIGLWIGEQSREHHDAEGVVREFEQRSMRACLVSRWDLSCIEPPGSGWRSWTGTELALPSFQLKARNANDEFDIFLEATDDDVWCFRRDTRIRLPLDAVTVRSASGLPVVRPEVQLLYM